MCATFGMSALDAWDVTNRTTVLAAANALLDYIRETQVDLVPFIEPLKLVEESQFIVLDPSTRRNLEVDESLSANGEGPTLFSVMDHCATAMGSREMRRWLREPLRSMEDTSARHDAVEAIMGDEPSREHFFAVLDALPDVERIASRVSLGTVRPRELASLRDTLPTLSALGASLADSPLDLIAGIGRSMTLNSEIWERLEQSLVPACSATATRSPRAAVRNSPNFGTFAMTPAGFCSKWKSVSARPRASIRCGCSTTR